MEPITRRELLSKSTVLLVLVPVAACSSTPASGVVQTPDDPSSCAGVYEISTVDNNHNHSLCVPTTDLTSPPAAGKQYTTSLDQGHTHTVTLTQMQLQTISSGGTVTVTTDPPVPFPHDFAIQKA